MAARAAAPRSAGVPASPRPVSHAPPCMLSISSQPPACSPPHSSGRQGLPGFAAAAGGGSPAAAAAAQPRADNKTAKYLDVREETYREALISAASAAQVGGRDGALLHVQVCVLLLTQEHGVQRLVGGDVS